MPISSASGQTVAIANPANGVPFAGYATPPNFHTFDIKCQKPFFTAAA